MAGMGRFNQWLRLTTSADRDTSGASTMHKDWRHYRTDDGLMFVPVGVTLGGNFCKVLGADCNAFGALSMVAAMTIAEKFLLHSPDESMVILTVGALNDDTRNCSVLSCVRFSTGRSMTCIPLTDDTQARLIARIARSTLKLAMANGPENFSFSVNFGVADFYNTPHSVAARNALADVPHKADDDGDDDVETCSTCGRRHGE
jgi:hypothetical protein